MGSAERKEGGLVCMYAALRCLKKKGAAGGAENKAPVFPSCPCRHLGPGPPLPREGEAPGTVASTGGLYTLPPLPGPSRICEVSPCIWVDSVST